MTDGLLEQVMKAIAMGAMFRKWPNADSAFIARQAERNWQDYEKDARFVIEVINSLVETEQFEDATANLPTTPAWMTQQ